MELTSKRTETIYLLYCFILPLYSSASQDECTASFFSKGTCNDKICFKIKVDKKSMKQAEMSCRSDNTTLVAMKHLNSSLEIINKLRDKKICHSCNPYNYWVAENPGTEHTSCSIVNTDSEKTEVQKNINCSETHKFACQFHRTCPDGWEEHFKKKCFFDGGKNRKLTYSDAVELCQQENATIPDAKKCSVLKLMTDEPVWLKSEVQSTCLSMTKGRINKTADCSKKHSYICMADADVFLISPNIHASTLAQTTVEDIGSISTIEPTDGDRRSMPLEKNTIIVVAAGSGAFIVVIGSVLMCILVYKRNKSPSQRLKELDEDNTTNHIEKVTDMRISMYESMDTLDTLDTTSTLDSKGSGESTCLEEEATPPEVRIPVSDLPAYVERMVKDRRLRAEYESIPSARRVAMKAGYRQSIRYKNRFIDIIPYDHSRVHLEHEEGDPLSDYINANYIDGYKAEKAFIASQGPNEYTVDDFWRMIWEQQCSTVVMVTNLTEGNRRKCTLYWPEKDSSSMYDDVYVTNEDEIHYHDYIIRKFKIVKNGEQRSVKQFHYIGWPDHGVPDNVLGVLRFYRRVAPEFKPHGRPCVVHCSAGVGRTGTLIAIDYLLKQARNEGVVDVATCVNKMRQDRAYMVQTLAQYEFIYQALVEELRVGKSNIPCEQFEEIYYTWMEDEDPSNERSKLNRQYKSMKQNPVMKIKDDGISSIQPSFGKRKLSDIIPGLFRCISTEEHIRLVAGRHLGENGPQKLDFINLCGYQRKDGCITPAPGHMHITQHGLWTTIASRKCRYMISLTEGLDEEDSTKLASQGTPITCPPYEISVEKKTVHERYITKEYQITSEEQQQSVTQIGMTCKLDDLSEIEIVSIFLDIYNQIYTNQCEEDGPVFVECCDNVQWTGLLSATLYLCDLISMEEEVDVYYVVNNLRLSGYQFITSMNQYRLLYKLARAFIKKPKESRIPKRKSIWSIYQIVDFNPNLSKSSPRISKTYDQLYANVEMNATRNSIKVQSNESIEKLTEILQTSNEESDDEMKVCDHAIPDYENILMGPMNNKIHSDLDSHEHSKDDFQPKEMTTEKKMSIINEEDENAKKESTTKQVIKESRTNDDDISGSSARRATHHHNADAENQSEEQAGNRDEIPESSRHQEWKTRAPEQLAGKLNADFLTNLQDIIGTPK